MESKIAAWTTEDVKDWLRENNQQHFENFVETYNINGKSLLVYDVHMFNALLSNDATGTRLLPPALIMSKNNEPLGWGENMEFLYHCNKLRQSIREDKCKNSKKLIIKRIGFLVVKNLIKQILKKVISEILKTAF